MRKWAAVIDGGAGIRKNDPNENAIRKSLKEIMNDVISLLDKGNSAIDSAERAVYLMEDTGLFNAGKGAALAMDGTVGLDAGIIDGGSNASGAVTGVVDYRHPIHAARFIMDQTNMVLMHGPEAVS